jgi:tetratricopeptide (TPR) repeat protein
VGPRARVNLVVAAAALAAAGAVVGVTVVQSPGSTNKAAAAPLPKGAPPLVFQFGLRTDAEARALERATALYAQHHRAAAARIFARYSSLEAKIGAAFSSWPDGSLDRVKQLVAERPHSSVAELHLGLALYWSGRRSDAATAFRRAERLEPDTYAALRAEDALHPEMAPGRPQFVPSFAAPERIDRLSPRKQLAALARLGGVKGKLLYGVALQRLERPVSAEREFAAAAALDPNDPEAQVAAAVGRFTKDAPARAFSRLGPLTLRFPHATTVRFHLGLLLLWLRQVPQARKELRAAVAEAPKSPLGREANTLLQSLRSIGTK